MADSTPMATHTSAQKALLSQGPGASPADLDDSDGENDDVTSKYNTQHYNESMTLSTVLPKGLSSERQWYLYEKVRPFCPHDAQDVTPTDPRPTSRRGTPAHTPPPETLQLEAPPENVVWEGHTTVCPQRVDWFYLLCFSTYYVLNTIVHMKCCDIHDLLLIQLLKVASKKHNKAL